MVEGLPKTDKVSTPTSGLSKTDKVSKTQNSTTPLATKTDTGYNKSKETTTPPKVSKTVENARKIGSLIKETKTPKKIEKPKQKPTTQSLPLEGKVSPQVTDEVSTPTSGLPKTDKVSTPTSEQSTVRRTEKWRNGLPNEYKSQTPKNLPNLDERNFAKGLLGEESERKAYNDGITHEYLKEGYLKNGISDDEKFKDGINGVETVPKYEFTPKADEGIKNQLFDLWDFGETPKQRQDAFKEIQSRFKYPQGRKAYNELHTATLPNTEPIEENAFKTSAKSTVSDQYLDNVNRTIAKSDGKSSATQQIIDDVGNAADVVDTATDILKLPQEVLDEVQKTYPSATDDLSNLGQFGRTLSAVAKKGARVATRAKALAKAINFIDAGVIYTNRIKEGYGPLEAAGRTVVNELAQYGFSQVCAKGGVAIASLIPIVGLPLAEGLGITGGLIADYLWGDDVGEAVESLFFDHNDKMIFQ